ncbi:hypothetical protein KLP28_10540 [Nocardioidaceae bacterium]|nr:hypothetical protein KLP28_10540 [Nocardioidaceae bacterium]
MVLDDGFEESRLDDPTALASHDGALRSLAEAGARVRREVGMAAEDAARVREELGGSRPRAVVAAGPDSRLLRAVLEPWCPVPFVAWPGSGLPGWTGGLDLVVILAPEGADRTAASAVAEAARRGAQVLVVTPKTSMVAEHAGRDTVVVPATTGDQLATAVVALGVLHDLGLGPGCNAEKVADALDQVAVDCGPQRDLVTNPAKELAIALADAVPVVWGGSVLAARAARRVSEAMRRSTGRSAVAGDAENLLPVLEGAPRRDVFADPYADEPAATRPVLVVLDDGNEAPMVREDRGRLLSAAQQAGVRVETVRHDTGEALASYAALHATGCWAAEYLALGRTRD